MKAALKERKIMSRDNIRTLTTVIEIEKMSDAEREALVWERRLRGMSYAAIARDLKASFAPGTLPPDYDAKAVYKDVMRVMTKVREEYKETALEMVDVELGRFDKLLEGVWASAEAGDLNAIDRALAISRERRKMLGLDRPELLQVDWRVQVVDLLQRGVVTPAQVAEELGEEALITVNQLLLEKRGDG